MKLRISAALVAVSALVATPAAAWASRITLNDTGMTQCIDHHKQWSTECSKSWQDAAYGRDVQQSDPDDGIAGFSFTKVCRSGQVAGEGSCPLDPAMGNGPDDWGCVYDNISQLTWETKTSDGGVHDYRRNFTNRGRHGDSADAAWLVDTTNAENLCGSTSWRLPDALELHSIVHYGQGAPDLPPRAFLDPTFFPYATPWITWTHNGLIQEPKWAWYVNFGDGDVSAAQRFDSTGSALLVHRTAQKLQKEQANIAKDRFIPSPDGTEVSDTLTGLVWSRCAAGMTWNNELQICSGAPATFGWRSALDYAKTNRDGGWRLPNPKELFSIADIEMRNPAINLTAFPNTPFNLPFISSTPTNVAGEIFVYEISYSDGEIFMDHAYGGNQTLIRLVRGGRK